MRQNSERIYVACIAVAEIEQGICKLRRAGGSARARRLAAGRHPGFPDVAIAALAQGADLTVLTRNARHFAPLGVPCSDPFERLPD